MAASQPFELDKEQDIIFGRVKDKVLIKEMGIKEFPSIYYYGPKYKEPERYEGDIAVDDIADFIVKKAKKQTYVPHEVQHTIELTPSNFDDIIETPKQFKMVLLYQKKNEEEIQMIEQLARIFQYEERLVLTRLNVDKHDKLKNKYFKMKVFPVLYWYSDTEKPTQARYGGGFDKQIILHFLNTHTGNMFLVDGKLSDKAGRIPEMDKMISENIESIREARNMKYVVNNARKAADFHKNKEFADYYVSLFERIMEAKSLNVIDTERQNLFIKLGQAVESKRKKLILRKKENIINFLVNEVGKDLFPDRGETLFMNEKDMRMSKADPQEQTDKIDIDEEEKREQKEAEEAKKAEEERKKKESEDKDKEKEDEEEKEETKKEKKTKAKEDEKKDKKDKKIKRKTKNKRPKKIKRKRTPQKPKSKRSTNIYTKNCNNYYIHGLIIIESRNQQSSVHVDLVYTA